MSDGESTTIAVHPASSTADRGDGATSVALLVWTAAIAGFFWDTVSLRGPCFILTSPRSTSLSRLLRRRAAGRPVLALVPGAVLRHAAVQRKPGGLSPSSQVFALPVAGTWQAFNLDTVLSIWLTG